MHCWRQPESQSRSSGSIRSLVLALRSQAQIRADPSARWREKETLIQGDLSGTFPKKSIKTEEDDRGLFEYMEKYMSASRAYKLWDPHGAFSFNADSLAQRNPCELRHLFEGELHDLRMGTFRTSPLSMSSSSCVVMLIKQEIQASMNISKDAFMKPTGI